MAKDVVIGFLSDMHSGGSTALFPSYDSLPQGFWQFKHTRYTPSGTQCDLHSHFEKCGAALGEQRQNKRLIVIHNGDAIDGAHHETRQLATPNVGEQADVHVWLMRRFLDLAKRQRGDQLYYISGTEAHTGDAVEDGIAAELGAVQNKRGGDIFDFLPLEVNGRLLWILHHGSAAGKGANSGDTLRNYLKRLYWQCKVDNLRPPDVVVSGHYHVPCYSTYVQEWHTIHGVILPSWQTKTRYAYRVAPVEVNKIGMQTIEVSASGDIKIPRPLLLKLAEENVQA